MSVCGQNSESGGGDGNSNNSGPGNGNNTVPGGPLSGGGGSAQIVESVNGETSSHSSRVSTPSQNLITSQVKCTQSLVTIFSLYLY